MVSRNSMYVIIKLVIYGNMHFQNISHNGTFYVTRTTKYAVIYVPGHTKLRAEQFSGLWDTKMLV